MRSTVATCTAGVPEDPSIHLSFQLGSRHTGPGSSASGRASSRPDGETVINRYQLKTLLDTLESLHAGESGELPGQARKPAPPPLATST